MADDVTTTNAGNNGATAVADPPQGDTGSRDMRALAAEAPAPLSEKKRGKNNKKKKQEDDDLEYEVEFATPFGKIEFEFEPLSKKKKKDEQKKERAEREAAKVAAKAAKLAEKRAVTGESGSGGGRGSTLLVVLVIVGVVAAAVVIAVWLFARPGEDDDAIPAEFLADDAVVPEPEPQGFVAKMRGRARNAIHAGKQASREAQAEQQRKFEQMSGR